VWTSPRSAWAAPAAAACERAAAANGIVAGPIGLALTYDDAEVIAANGMTGDLSTTPVAGAACCFSCLYMACFL
jgi:hypothetical protein